MSIFETLEDRPTAAYTWAKHNTITCQTGWQHIAGKNLAYAGLAEVMCGAVTKSRFKPSMYVNAGIAERIITTPLTKPELVIKEQLPVSRKGIFNRVKSPANTIVTTHQHNVQVTMGRLTSTDSDTPAFVVGYHTLTNSTQLGDAYKTGDGRTGAALTVATAMDEASANEFTDQLLNNPPLIREYAEYVLRKCIGISEVIVPMPNYSLFDERNMCVQFANGADTSPTEGQVVPVS